MSGSGLFESYDRTVAPRRPAESTGSRVASFAVSLVIGAVYGAVATVGHRHVLVIGEFVLPWGIVAALAGVACLLIGIRLVVGRLASAAAAFGIIGVVALLSLPGPGGSVLVPGSVIGTIWAVGPALIAVLVVAWPSLSAMRPANPRRSPGA